MFMSVHVGARTFEQTSPYWLTPELAHTKVHALPSGFASP